MMKQVIASAALWSVACGGTTSTTVDGGACGAPGDACCPAAACDVGLVCRAATCVSPMGDASPLDADLMDAGRGSRQTGDPCTNNSDCEAGICLSVGQPPDGGPGWTGNVCTTTCATATDCIAGWTCSAGLGQSSQVCQCTYAPEICDGKDNDCNGIVDDEPQVDLACSNQQAGYVCKSGQCSCAVTCNSACVDTQNDPRHCGGCGNVCSAPTLACVAGQCACPNGMSACGAACIDTSGSDSNNCGGCGQLCATHLPSTATCSAGHCLVTLASGQNGPYGIALDAQNVYWTDYTGGAVMSVPLAGGTPVTLASGQNGPYGIAVDATYAYWTDFGGAAVMKVALAGGMPLHLASNRNAGPFGIAVDNTSVYWTENGSGVMKVALAGGAPTTLAMGSCNPALMLPCHNATYGIAVDNTSVYWMDLNPGTVQKVALMGGAATVLAASLRAPYGLAVDSTSVYWTEMGGAIAGSGTVMKVALAGGTPVVLAVSQNAPNAITVDSTNVYWTDPGGTMTGGGAIRKVPLSGGGSVTLASGSSYGIAVDSTSLYWTDYRAGTVMKVSK